MAFEERTFVSTSLYRNYSLLVRQERQLSLMRRIALVVRSSKARVDTQGKQSALYCREQRFTVAGWQPSPMSYSGNQKAPVDLAERELQLDIRHMITQHVSPEAHFAFTDPGALRIGLAEIQCNDTTGMLRCTVSPELAYAPFPPSSTSMLELP